MVKIKGETICFFFFCFYFSEKIRIGVSCESCGRQFTRNSMSYFYEKEIRMLSATNFTWYLKS